MQSADYSGSQESKVLFQGRMPNAQCPMPNAQCPRTPHVTEKGYITKYFRKKPGFRSPMPKSSLIVSFKKQLHDRSAFQV